MTAIAATLCALLGLAIGSFLNVVIWRVPRGESIVAPPSHCPACGGGIAPRDNVPLLGWLMLRGRCRRCKARISVRYPLVEAATALLFGATAVKVGPHASLPAFLYLASIAIALALIDLETFKLPNVIVLPSYIVGAVLLGVSALIDHNDQAAARAVAGMAIYYSAFFILWFVYPRGMGFGDVKLAGVLGLYLGYCGWGVLAVGALGGVLLGGVIGIALILFAGAGRKTKVPYGPFMLTGAVAAIFIGATIAQTYAQTAGLS
jgi:leader peptidase (prepilin peptidase)/N-methyltransferase